MPATSRKVRPIASYDFITVNGKQLCTTRGFAQLTHRARPTVKWWFKHCPPLRAPLPYTMYAASLTAPSQNPRTGRFNKNGTTRRDRLVAYIEVSLAEKILAADAAKADEIERDGKKFFWEQTAKNVLGCSLTTFKKMVRESATILGKKLLPRRKLFHHGTRVYWPLDESKKLVELWPGRSPPLEIRKGGKPWGTRARLVDILKADKATVRNFIRRKLIAVISHRPPNCKPTIYGSIEHAVKLKLELDSDKADWMDAREAAKALKKKNADSLLASYSNGRLVNADGSKIKSAILPSRDSLGRVDWKRYFCRAAINAMIGKAASTPPNRAASLQRKAPATGQPGIIASPTEFGRALGVNPKTIKRWEESGKLTIRRITSKRWEIPREQLATLGADFARLGNA